MNPRDFLFELGTEELPPKSLKRLMKALADGIGKRLDGASLTYASLTPFATPRRLAVLVTELDARQPDARTERRGPPVKIAFDAAGEPTTAALKFVQGCGVTMDDLSTVKNDKGEWLYYEGIEKGRTTLSLLPGIVTEALAELPIARRMRWGARREEFVRPVHWCVMLWGDAVVDATVIGVASGRHTRGHRFHAPAAIELNTPADYAGKLLEQGRVIAQFDIRREKIADHIDATAKRLGGRAIVDDALLDEVTALVEWPVPVAGEFDARFLDLPREVLISTLKDHQRYFPVTDDSDALLPWFITLSNIESRNPDAVKNGNERVVRPRLTDAEFFYRVDRKTPLAARVDTLANVVFQKQLGSLKDKSERVAALAAQVASVIGADAERTQLAASLAKCDLLTEMVGEFPDLQGTMGRYYALHDGHPDDVAAAMAEQYLPRFAGDALPHTKVGQALAIADRLDTITGIFALGKKPSGTRDPFALRRAALGVLRIMLECNLDLDLGDLLRAAAAAVAPRTLAAAKKPAYVSEAALVDDVHAYFVERLRGHLLDDAQLATTAGVFDAVLATAPAKPLDFVARVGAVTEFMQHDAFTALAAANKRSANILKKSGAAQHQVETALLVEPAELALHRSATKAASAIAPLLQERDYTRALTHLAGLRHDVDKFFDDVLVMADDDAVRRNRMALLRQLRELFLGIADFSKIQ